MAYYQVFLRGGICAGIEVSDKGTIINAAPVLRKSIGLPYTKFSAWVKSKQGEIFPVKESPGLPREKLTW